MVYKKFDINAINHNLIHLQDLFSKLFTTIILYCTVLTYFYHFVDKVKKMSGYLALFFGASYIVSGVLISHINIPESITVDEFKKHVSVLKFTPDCSYSVSALFFAAATYKCYLVTMK